MNIDTWAEFNKETVHGYRKWMDKMDYKVFAEMKKYHFRRQSALLKMLGEEIENYFKEQTRGMVETNENVELPNGLRSEMRNAYFLVKGIRKDILSLLKGQPAPDEHKEK